VTPPTSLRFFKQLRWIDGRPLLDVIESYRRDIFTRALDARDDTGHPKYNLVLCGRGKKNWKSCDLTLAALYRLFAWDSPGGNQSLLLANDLGQANDDLELATKLVRANRVLARASRITANKIVRRDDRGALLILPAQDITGSHGKTYCFLGLDEIHGYKDWSLLEALALDPTRPDALMWVTSYASLHHRPGAPLHDLMQTGKAGTDGRMYFSWYAGDYTTDPAFADASPEERANPSLATFAPGYLDQQRGRLPMHLFRRLHLNLPGLPAGSAFSVEKVLDAIDRTARERPPEPGTFYQAFVDMSGGSSDDATLAIGFTDPDGRAVVVKVVNQGGSPPFDPRKAVARFAAVLKAYGVYTVTGDKYAGETFAADFANAGIGYLVSPLTKSQLYESLEPALNGGRVVLPNVPEVESQLLGLCWRGGKIDHPGGEHDDHANAVAGLVHGLLTDAPWVVDTISPWVGGERVAWTMWQ
jgi:hypothetical protein